MNQLELDIEKKRLSIESLRRKPSPEAMESLIEAMKDESWRIRKTALEILLEDYQPEEYVEKLIGLLYLGDNAGARNTAIEALTRLGKKVTPYLIRAFDTDDRDVRKFIIDILGSLDDRRAIPLMLKALSDEDDNVKVTAVEHLGRVKESSVTDALIEILKSDDLWTAYPAADALGRIGDRKAIPYLVEALSKKTLRVPVLKSLSRFAEPSTLPFIAPLLNDPSKTVQEEALKTIVKFYHRGVQPEFITDCLKNFFDEDTLIDICLRYAWSNKHELRISAIMLLGLLRNERALQPLLEISQEEEYAEDVKKALVFMARSKPECLLPLFDLENAYYRRFIATIAGEVGSVIYSQKLIDYLHDEDGHVRAIAAKALSMIGEHGAVPYIKRLLEDPYEDVQEAACESLSVLSEAVDIHEVRSWLGSSDPRLRRNATRLLGLLKVSSATQEIGFALKDSDPSVRRAAVEALRRIGSEEAKRYLNTALTDEIRDIRVAAIYSLGDIGGKDVVGIMSSLLHDRDDFIKVAAIKVLGKIKDPASLSDLMAMLKEPNGFVRTSAIESLSVFKMPSVMEAIINMLEDEDREIRRTAIEALADYEPGHVKILPFLRSDDWILRSSAVKALRAAKDPAIIAELEALLDREEDESIKKMLMEILDVKRP
ncbi:MAG: HEAT repeat domain-containing protein [Thermodesulfovibrionales bacterium]|nr:HEAT repeat domain-containing protein [Thermodesulfovibrionales bacterium]